MATPRQKNLTLKFGTKEQLDAFVAKWRKNEPPIPVYHGVVASAALMMFFEADREQRAVYLDRTTGQLGTMILRAEEAAETERRLREASQHSRGKQANKPAKDASGSRKVG